MLYKKPLVNLTPLLDLLFIVIFAYQMNVNLEIDHHIQTEVEKRVDQHNVEKQQHEKNLEQAKAELLNIVEMINVGGGQLVCCGKPMKHLVENTTDAATEKHVPVIEKTADGVKVVVGSVEHPMADDHYIQWIQLIVDGLAYRQFLEPGGKPEAVFKVDGDKISAREYCNLHGLWKA